MHHTDHIRVLSVPEDCDCPRKLFLWFCPDADLNPHRRRDSPTLSPLGHRDNQSCMIGPLVTFIIIVLTLIFPYWHGLVGPPLVSLVARCQTNRSWASYCLSLSSFISSVIHTLFPSIPPSSMTNFDIYSYPLSCLYPLRSLCHPFPGERVLLQHVCFVLFDNSRYIFKHVKNKVLAQVSRQLYCRC